MTSEVVVQSDILTPTEMRQLYARCVSLWGIRDQEDMLTEECGELIVAINHHRRGRVLPSRVLEEIADVLFMVGEVMYIHGFTTQDLKLMVDTKILTTTDRVIASEKKLSEQSKFRTKEINNGKTDC